MKKGRRWLNKEQEMLSKGKIQLELMKRFPGDTIKVGNYFKVLSIRKLKNSVIFHCMRGSYFVVVKFSVYACFLGLDFGEMSSVLNGWLNSSVLASPCSFWKVEEIQQLQALLYLAR